MKSVRIFIMLTIFVTIIFGTTACANTTKTNAYGLVHRHYVAKVTMTFRNDKIQKLSIDEAETPYSWARIDKLTTTIATTDIITNTAFTGSGTNREYARKIKIGDIVFIARENGESNAYVDYYNTDKNGNTSFEDWLKIHDNAKWYYEHISNGSFDILKDDASPYNVEFVDPASGPLSKSNRWIKSKNGYWAADLGGKGWVANMDAVSNYIVANGLNDYISTEGDDIEKDENDEYVINNVKTGATLENFTDYMDLAVAAYNKHNAHNKLP